MFSPGFYLENILELLNKQSQDFDIVDEEQHVSSVKGIWGKMEAEEALSDPALQEDLNVFRKKYSKEELSKTPLANLNLIAKIKAGSELAGGLVKWNREGTAIVKVKEGPLTNDEKLERLIEIILRHERAKV